MYLQVRGIRHTFFHSTAHHTYANHILLPQKYLLNYHREYYSKQGKKKFLASARRWRGSKEDAITEYGELALWVKKQILINNIFGVDIDSNAVEVTKLSLLLKCMENETPASIMNNQSLFNERALPSLDENIKCGNSLILTLKRNIKLIALIGRWNFQIFLIERKKRLRLII